MKTPFSRFLAGLEAAKLDFNEVMDELRAFAEVMARKQNSIELDEEGLFYTTACGPLEKIIPEVEKQLKRLQRIKEEKDASK